MSRPALRSSTAGGRFAPAAHATTGSAFAGVTPNPHPSLRHPPPDSNAAKEPATNANRHASSHGLLSNNTQKYLVTRSASHKSILTSTAPTHLPNHQDEPNTTTPYTNSSHTTANHNHIGHNNALKRRRGSTTLHDDHAQAMPRKRQVITHGNKGMSVLTNGLRLSLPDNDPSSGTSTPLTGSVNGTLNIGKLAVRDESRSLRSKSGGSRLKSDLAIYFSDYEDIINNAPKSPELVKFNQPILIVDEPLMPSNGASQPSGFSATNNTNPHTQAPKDLNPSSVNKYSRIDISELAIPCEHAPFADDPCADPLGDDVFFRPHRRAERREKQLRNIEKERAQHEKWQLEKLLEGLLGPDWLKVMGVTGVTDGERKNWEPKREHFIREVRILLNKFKTWRETEKRLLIEKEIAIQAREDEMEQDEEQDEDEEDGEEGELEERVDVGIESSIDVEASAEQQLHREAGTYAPAARAPRRPRRGYIYLPLEPPSQQKEFTTFFSKPHLRAAALGKSRHGRSVMAFGCNVPELHEQEFSLPEEYITPDALRVNARKRRRLNRERKEAAEAAAAKAKK